MRLPRLERPPAVGYSGAGFFMAGFIVLWRILGMDLYRAYVYCEECDRPLRENEYRSETTGSGKNRSTTYYCGLCNSEARAPWSVWVVKMALLSIPILVLYAATGNNLADSPLQVFGVCFIPLFFLFLDWRMKSKCKPIYDRWVINHGINPIKWPELPQAPAQTTAQSLARTTTAQSLGRSLGRSLGWLLFGHPILFWSLLIGAALAIIYSGSWKAEVTAPKMQLPTIQMDTIHPFDL